MILFGGYDPALDRHVGDTWEWDGVAWTRLDVVGPSARGVHAMGFDERTNVVLLFGGLPDNGQILRDTWAWDGKTWQLKDGFGPLQLPGRVLTQLGPAGDVMFFGGMEGGRLHDETWLWTGERWLGFQGPAPKKRALHGVAYVTTRQSVLLFGGIKAGNKALRDAWEFRDGAWNKLPKCP